MTLEEMRAARAAQVAAMEALHKTATDEKRDLNEEEQTKYDAAKAEVASLDKRISREEELAGLKKPLTDSNGAVSRGASIVRAGGEPAKKEFESLSHFLATAVLNPNDQRLTGLYQNSTFDNGEEGGMRSEQSMGEGIKGGFMVPMQFRSELLQVNQQAAIVRPRATVIEAGSPPDAAISIPALDQTGTAPDHIRGGVSVSWIEEGGAKPETDAKLRQILLQPKEVAAHIKISDKLLRNWQASAAFLEKQLREAVIAAEDLAFITGNGVGKPLGLANSAAAYAVNRGTASQIHLDDVQSMFARVKMGSGLTWVASQSIIPQLLNLRNEIGSPAVGDGSLVYQPNVAAGQPQTLMGYPIIWNERSPALGTKGDLMLVDFSAYLIKDGSGPFVASDGGIVNFTTNKTLVKVFWNVDGQPWLTAPIKHENGYEVSPFVVLDVPA